MLTDDYFKKFELIVTATILTAKSIYLIVVFVVVYAVILKQNNTKTT